MKKKMIPVIVAIVLILVIAALGVGSVLLQKYSYSEDRADLKEYFEVHNDEEVVMILQNEKLEERARIIEGVYYFDFATVQKYFNGRFYVDENEKLLLYTTPTEIIRVSIETNDYLIGGETKTEAFKIATYQGETLYVAADYVKKFTNFSYEAFSDPKRMQIYTEWGIISKAEIKKDTAIRVKGGVKSEILKDVAVGEDVVILEEMENWSKVKTMDALTGYVENKQLTNYQEEKQVAVTDYQEPVYTNISKDYTVNLAWHQVTNIDANSNFDTAIANTKAVNTISPTWFFLNDNNGNFVNIASLDYVNKAHAKGMEVWALLENIAYKDQIDIHEILSYTSKREYLIQNLVQAVMQYDIDGINVDLEAVPEKTGQHYIEFIRELSIACRANGIVLSVDNYVPREHSSHYNRKEQGIVADYVIIMGYDEHWHNSGDAGSVASIDFVEDGIKKTLDEVPATKVINAVPFYTNVWKTIGSETTDQQLGMVAAESFVKGKGVEAIWDEETCQNYVEFKEGDAFYQIWLEDEKSLEVKLNIMAKYQLAGVASWKLGLEKSSIWDVMENYVQN